MQQSSSIRISADVIHLHLVRECVHAHAAIAHLSEKERLEISLAVDEAATNIVEHAAREQVCEIECECFANTESQTFTVELRYNSEEAFAAVPPPHQAIQERVQNYQRGGLGIFLIHRLVDSIDYLHSNGRTIVRMVKKHHD